MHLFKEKLFLLPCEYNYRPDHCMYTSTCNASMEGIKILHGNRGIFHSTKQPLFSAVFQAIESYQLDQHPFSHFLMPLQTALEDTTIVASGCGKMAKEILHYAKNVFRNEYTYDSYVT